MFPYLLKIWFLTIGTCWANAGTSFNKEHFIVKFDPYVSTADIGQPGKYKADDLVPMIQQISTRFSKLMHDVSIEDIPYATALVNVERHNGGQSPLEVYMTFKYSDEPHNLEVEKIQQLADNANVMFNGTVQRFMFDFVRRSNVQNVLRKLKTAQEYLANGTYPYKLGIVIYSEACKKTDENFPHYLIPILGYVDVVFVDVEVYYGYTFTGPHQEFQRIRRIFNRCKKAISSLKQEVEIGFQTGWLRYQSRKGEDFDSQLVEYWRLNNEWATKANTTVCLFEAFDTPYKPFLQAKMGIWQLDETFKYANSSEYVFVDKVKLVEIDERDARIRSKGTTNYKKSAKNTTATHFSRNVIVWFDPYVATADINDAGNYDIMDIVPMVEKISTKFSKIMVKSKLQGDTIDKSIEAIPYATALVNAQVLSGKPQLEVYMTFGISSKGTHFNFEEIVQLADIANAKSKGTVSNFVLNLVTQTNADAVLEQIKMAKTVLQKNINRQYKLGIIVMDKDECRPTSVHFPGYLANLLWYVDMVYFDAQVATQKGPLAEFKRVHKIFKRCQKAVWALKPGVDVGFQTGWIKQHKNFPDYDHDSELVAYWKLVSDWATKTSTTVIFYEAFDNLYKDKVWNSNGFWKLDESVLYENSSEYIFVEKSSASLNYPVLKTPEMRNITSLIESGEKYVNFNRKYVAVWFEPYVSVTDIADPGSYHYTEIIPLIDVVATKFTKIIIGSIYLNDGSTGVVDMSTATIPYATAVTNKNNLNRTNYPLEVIMTFYNSGDSGNLEFEKVLANAEQANEHFNGTVQTIIYDIVVTKDNKNEVVTNLKSAKKTIKTAKFSYNLGILMTDEHFKDASVMYMGNIGLILAQVDLIIVSVDMRKDNTVRGALSEFERVTQVFDKCKTSIRSVNERLEPGLLTAWIKGDNIGNDNYQMQLVDYWKLIGVWASDSNTDVYLQHAFDIPFKYDKWSKAGLWRLDETYLYDNTSQYIFVDKIKEIEERDNAAKQRNSDFHRKRSNKINRNSNTSTIMLLGVICIIVLFVLSICGLILNKYVTWNGNNNQLKSYELDDFFDGGEFAADGCKIEEIFGLAYNSELELANEQFFFDEESILGRGAFGVVYQGWVEKPKETRKNVAVKTTKESCPNTALKGLLSEIKVLSYLGKHDNIVNIIGAYTQQLNEGKLYVFTELCALGSLQSFLRANHEQSEYTFLHASETSEDAPENICSSTNFQKWSTQIATGLEFMTAKQVVHADIATRNILLTADKTAKISDFGLSRRLYDYETYVKKQQEPLPWRWMAPEALRLHEFNEKSDVWSFGITLWEIYSFGSVPYPGLSWTSDFALNLEQGLRVEQTPTCTDEIYTIILECCQTNPNLRPTFTKLKEAFE